MTESLARFSARRPLLVVALWLLLVLAALFFVRILLPSATTTDLRLAGGYDSEQAARLLETGLRGPETLAEIVIIRSEALTVGDDSFRAKVEAVHQGITSLGPDVIDGGLGGSSLSHYYQLSDARSDISDDQADLLLPLLVSPSERTVMMHYTLAGTAEEATANVHEVIDVVREANEADDFLVLVGGDASVVFENNELAERDLQRGERFGVPVALLVLLILFGAVVATLLPLGLAAVSIAVALGVVSLIGQQFQLFFFVNMMVVMLGLAVGIDYSLLVVLRFKEELARGFSSKNLSTISGICYVEGITEAGQSCLIPIPATLPGSNSPGFFPFWNRPGGAPSPVPWTCTTFSAECSTS